MYKVFGKFLFGTRFVVHPQDRNRSFPTRWLEVPLAMPKQLLFTGGPSGFVDGWVDLVQRAKVPNPLACAPHVRGPLMCFAAVAVDVPEAIFRVEDHHTGADSFSTLLTRQVPFSVHR